MGGTRIILERSTSRSQLWQSAVMRALGWFAFLLSFPVFATATSKASTAEDAQFRRWLVHYLKSDPDYAHDRDFNNLMFGYALVDLNGDGRNEAVVYITEAGWCGSSGCDLEIFERSKSGWRPFGVDLGNTRAPIRLLPSKTHGWHDLGGWQFGGGVDRPFESWISIYPRDNDPKRPAKVPRRIRGRIIIKTANVPLFPSVCRRAEEAGRIFGPMSMRTGKPGSC